ncbi:YeeE/YedE family protein [Nguyenibacter vanlangensis]|uniref:YeeE/YedE family protein n=1 Tax=Nguyenibacter vanlangensis TaxID=1216886 RepID=UPI0038D1DB55
MFSGATMNGYWASLCGGMLIGLSAAAFLLLDGRIAGISGIVGRLLLGQDRSLNGAFVLGLLLGPVAYLGAFGDWPVVRIAVPLPLVILAGFLVGFGTRMGSGCTSGHGVMGLARLSPRSMAAVATFMATGILTVTLMRIAGL